MQIIFLLFSIFIQCQCQFIPYNPCPNIFKYKSRSDQYKYGLITVPSPPIGEPIVPLNLLFSLRSRLPTKYGGLIELFGTRSEAIENILDQQPIRFLIHFPMQSPLPKLELISYQNDILCSAEPEYNLYYNVDQRKSIIEFRYSFNTTGLLSSQTTESPLNLWPSSPSLGLLNFNDEQNDGLLLSEIQNEIKPPVRKSKKMSSLILKENEENEQCGQQDKRFLTSPLIAGGKPIEHGSWPWISAIYIIKSTGLQFICTGNLISSTTVITSAHCFDYNTIMKRSRPDVMVFLGRHNLSEWMEEGTEMRRVSKLHIHPEYRISGSNQNDRQIVNDANIAIIILKNPINYSVYIRPICLWNLNVDDDDEIVNSTGVLVGWGSDARSMRLATIPQRINIKIIDKNICFKSNPQIFETLLTNRTICGGEPDGLTGPCHGDSGAGLAILKNGRMRLRGLVGVGITNPANLCDLTQYSIYTDLTKFSTWILNIMEK